AFSSASVPGPRGSRARRPPQHGNARCPWFAPRSACSRIPRATAPAASTADLPRRVGALSLSVPPAWLSPGIRKAHGLQLGENLADKKASLNAQQKPVGIVGNPNAGASEFLVRFEFTSLADLVELEIELDRGVVSGRDRDRLAGRDCDRGQVGTGGRINHQSIDVAFMQRLAANVKEGGMHVEDAAHEGKRALFRRLF